MRPRWIAAVLLIGYVVLLLLSGVQGTDHLHGTFLVAALAIAPFLGYLLGRWPSLALSLAVIPAALLVDASGAVDADGTLERDWGVLVGLGFVMPLCALLIAIGILWRKLRPVHHVPPRDFETGSRR